MNIPIIASSFIDIWVAVVAMGYENLPDIKWIRQPTRIKSVWYAEIQHGARAAL